MARLHLKRVVRAHRAALEALMVLVDSPVRVDDAKGRTVFGEGDGERHPLRFAGKEVGAVFGSKGASEVVALIEHLFAAEAEKRALADETLERYKELTLLYDMAETLSRVLDVGGVAARVVEQTHRFLKPTRSALLLHDRVEGDLDAIARLGPEGDEPTEWLERRVLESGRAELSEGTFSAMAAPLRSGETVFGMLRVTHVEAGRWNAGHLKMLASMAANAAGAISHAQLQAEQLRRQALRGRIERFVSPHLVEAALAGRELDGSTGVLFVDVSGVSPVHTERPEEALHLATSIVLEVLMHADATVDVTQGEMLIALFPHVAGFEASARRATEAAMEVLCALDLRFGGPFVESPGVGVARAQLSRLQPRETLLAGLAVAATLQSLSAGRVLVDEDVAQALGDRMVCIPAEEYQLVTGSARAHEVRP